MRKPHNVLIWEKILKDVKLSFLWVNNLEKEKYYANDMTN